ADRPYVLHLEAVARVDAAAERELAGVAREVATAVVPRGDVDRTEALDVQLRGVEAAGSSSSSVVAPRALRARRTGGAGGALWTLRALRAGRDLAGPEVDPEQRVIQDLERVDRVRPQLHWADAAPRQRQLDGGEARAAERQQQGERRNDHRRRRSF